MIKRHPPDKRLIALSDEGPGSVQRAAGMSYRHRHKADAKGCDELSTLKSAVLAPIYSQSAGISSAQGP